MELLALTYGGHQHAETFLSPTVQVGKQARQGREDSCLHLSPSLRQSLVPSRPLSCPSSTCPDPRPCGLTHLLRDQLRLTRFLEFQAPSSVGH